MIRSGLALAVVISVAGLNARADEPAVTDPALEKLLADAEAAPFLAKALDCRAQGLSDEALEQLRKANAVIKKRRGASHPEQLPILDLAAEILFVDGRFAEAVTPLERAVTIRETLVADSARDDGDHDVALASSLLLLGKAYVQIGDKPKAVAALKRAADLFSASLGEDHDATTAARQELATVADGGA